MIGLGLIEKVSLFAISVSFRRNAKMLGKNSVKIAQILVTYANADISHLLIGVTQKPGGLGQPFFLEKLGISLAGAALDLPTEPGHIIVQYVRNFRQGAIGKVFFNIAQHPNDGILLFIADRQLVGMV